MTTTINTTTTATATAYSNQRKIDRTSNGVLWALYSIEQQSATVATAYYSTDNGATWAIGSNIQNGSAGAGQTYVRNASFFIDLDDYAHVVFKDNSDGYLYYRRGTPNAGRTAWTWSAATVVLDSTTYDLPDIIAHREGTGWVAHVVSSYFLNGNDPRTYYARVTVASGGAVTVSPAQLLNDVFGGSTHTYPSIDFHHTGDGKTVAGGTPHLYVGWSAGATGAGKGVRFRKATYAAGSWTWGTEQEIDNTRYVMNGQYWLNCLFDGSRVVIGGQVLDASGYADLVLHERDAADTTTTSRVLVDNSASGNVGVEFYAGSLTYDSNGNIYILGIKSGTKYYYRKWTRSTSTFESGVTFDSTGVSETGYVSTKRGYSANKIEYIYTDGTASPFSVTYGNISLNRPPTAPTNVLVSQGARAGIQGATVTWQHNDPDNDPQAQYQIRWMHK